jgi:hypothetical protein
MTLAHAVTDKGRDVSIRGRVVAEVAGEDVLHTVPTLVPAGTPAAHFLVRLPLCSLRLVKLPSLNLD